MDSKNKKGASMKAKKCKYYRKINGKGCCFGQKLAPRCYCDGQKASCELNKRVRIKEVKKND